MQRIIRVLVPILAFVIFTLSAAIASATNDQVCSVRHYPGVTVYGQSGTINVTIYTQADCQGTFVGSYWLCTTGGNFCAFSSVYRHNEASLLAHFAQLRAAEESNQPVTASVTSCGDGSPGCLALITYGRVP